MAQNNPTPIEVLPPVTPRPFIEPVKFDMQTTVQSPLFWLVIGLGAGFGLAYYFGKQARKG